MKFTSEFPFYEKLIEHSIKAKTYGDTLDMQYGNALCGFIVFSASFINIVIVVISFIIGPISRIFFIHIHTPAYMLNLLPFERV